MNAIQCSRRVLSTIILVAILATSCEPQDEPVVPASQQSAMKSSQQSDGTESQATVSARERMVQSQFAARDIINKRVLEVMRRVPRHEFVPNGRRDSAYDDHPLPIGEGQTISQPYIVALMTQLVDPQPSDKALDVGTGSGYQAAVLAELVKHVYSIEIVEPLADRADATLQRLGYKNVTVRHGDGYHGWKSEAPFDLIIVAAAPDHIPEELVKQLAPEGKMVIPVGSRWQTLILIEKKADGTIRKHNVAPVAFVPMTGDADR
jgi:protein-L-isoaspartate(D-aspartate) O-methyltransferase